MWQQETIPQEFKDASIIHLYKQKGKCQVCNNHQGILLSITGNILARILLNCLTTHIDQGLPTSELMWIPERAWDHRHGVRCKEQYADLFSTYVDLTKAFDTVSRKGLWKIMAKYGCPRKLFLYLHGAAIP